MRSETKTLLSECRNKIIDMKSDGIFINDFFKLFKDFVQGFYYFISGTFIFTIANSPYEILNMCKFNSKVYIEGNKLNIEYCKEALDFFNRYTGEIEIVHDGKAEFIYYPMLCAIHIFPSK